MSFTMTTFRNLNAFFFKCVFLKSPFSSYWDDFVLIKIFYLIFLIILGYVFSSSMVALNSVLTIQSFEVILFQIC